MGEGVGLASGLEKNLKGLLVKGMWVRGTDMMGTVLTLQGEW